MPVSDKPTESKPVADAPKVDQGKGFVALQSALLQHLDPDPKALSGNQTPSRQFKSLNSAGKVPQGKRGSVKKIRKISF